MRGNVVHGYGPLPGTGRATAQYVTAAGTGNGETGRSHYYALALWFWGISPRGSYELLCVCGRHSPRTKRAPPRKWPSARKSAEIWYTNTGPCPAREPGRTLGRTWNGKWRSGAGRFACEIQRAELVGHRETPSVVDLLARSSGPSSWDTARLPSVVDLSRDPAGRARGAPPSPLCGFGESRPEAPMSYYVSVGKNYFRAVIDAIDGLDKARKERPLRPPSRK